MVLAGEQNLDKTTNVEKQTCFRLSNAEECKAEAPLKQRRGKNNSKCGFLKTQPCSFLPVVQLLPVWKARLTSFPGPYHNSLIDPWQDGGWGGGVHICTGCLWEAVTHLPPSPIVQYGGKQQKTKHTRCGGLLTSWTSLLTGERDTDHRNRSSQRRGRHFKTHLSTPAVPSVTLSPAQSCAGYYSD